MFESWREKFGGLWQTVFGASSPPLPIQPPGFDSAFALIGCQRSGTHLLRELLNTSPLVAVLAEVFSKYPQRVYWQNYIRLKTTTRFPPELVADASVLMDEYFELVRQNVHRNPDWYGGDKPELKTIGLDIKYNQLRFVTPVFDDLTERPFLIRYFSERNIGVVHLMRRNLMHSAISIIVANARSFWQNYDGRKIEGRYHVPPEKMLAYMRWIASERDHFRRFAHDLTICECFYEDIVADLARVDADGAFPEDTLALRPLAKFLGVPNKFRYPGTIQKAINRPYEEVIENYDDVVRRVADSEFAELVPAKSAA